MRHDSFFGGWQVSRITAFLAAVVAMPGGLAQDFRVEPYLQNPASDAITIRWLSETADTGSLSIDGRVFLSTPTPATALDYQPAEATADRYTGLPYIHSIRVTELDAGAVHTYAVTQGEAVRTGAVRTPVAANAITTGSGVRLFVYGDSETEPESVAKRADWTASLAADSTRPEWIPTRSATVNGVPVSVDQYLATQRTGYSQNLAIMQARAADAQAGGRATLAAVAGDLVESGGEQRDWDEFWRHNAGSLASDPGAGGFAGMTAIVPALGNHENFGGPGALGGYSATAAAAAVAKYQTYFEVPDNAASIAEHTGRYHRVDFGPVTLITLDSSNTGTDNTANDTNFFLTTVDNPQIPDTLAGSEQYHWLENQLASAQAAGQITFVQMHHAPYSSGVHGLPPGTDANFEDTQSGWPLRSLTPLFALYDVKAVFSGHDEMYEHAVVDGIHFYDVGTGGDGLRGFDFEPDGYTREFLAQADAPEVWDGNVLVSGGKHYGHLEIDVVRSDSGTWDVTMTPAYAFPVLSATNPGEILRWERRTYDDVVSFSVVPEPSTLAGAGLAIAVIAGFVCRLRVWKRQGPAAG